MIKQDIYFFINLLNYSTIVCCLRYIFSEKRHIHFIVLKTRLLKTLREPLAQSFGQCVIKLLPLFLNFPRSSMCMQYRSTIN